MRTEAIEEPDEDVEPDLDALGPPLAPPAPVDLGDTDGVPDRGIPQRTRGDHAELLQAFQDWLVEKNASDPYDKTRMRLMLLIPGTGSTFVPLQARYRAWLGDLADGWGLFWLINIRYKMGEKGLGLLYPPRTSEDVPQYTGPYNTEAMIKTLRKFVEFLQANKALRRRLFT